MTAATVAIVAAVLASIAGLLFWITRRDESSGTLPRPMLLFLRLTLAFLFAILGVIGALLPVLQGWLFFLASAVLLFPQSRLAVKAVEKIEPKMPRLAHLLRKLEIGLPRETAPRS